MTLPLTRWHRRVEFTACAAATGSKTACYRHFKCVVERSISWSLSDDSVNTSFSTTDGKVLDDEEAMTLRNCITQRFASFEEQR
jgi:hypothetical protein